MTFSDGGRPQPHMALCVIITKHGALRFKVWSNFLDTINATGQYLVGESFVRKKKYSSRERVISCTCSAQPRET